MKGVLLCSEKKTCVHCSKALKLKRKQMDWLSTKTGRVIKKPTNVWECEKCKIDHVLKGTHIDDSGWETIELPIRDFKRHRPYESSRIASPVKSYIDPSLKNPVKPSVKKSDNKPLSHHSSTNNETKKDNLLEKSKMLRGIRISKSASKNCEKCDFYINNRCTLHRLKTKSNEVCSRFKHYYVKVYLGGSMSPR